MRQRARWQCRRAAGRQRRARPRHVLDFGGDASFTPAWVVADQCHGNCSFVSGDVTFAASLLGRALLFPATRRLPWLGYGLAATLVTSFLRMASGAHFLSDALFAGLIGILVALVGDAVRDFLARRFSGRGKTLLPQDNCL